MLSTSLRIIFLQISSLPYALFRFSSYFYLTNTRMLFKFSGYKAFGYSIN